ncbi:proline-rich extensin-like protein EPR1 [Gigantopelta aegis]|uniref:proline-rich extensin-like protein EPR1 n=1 Tax=Gigantopelta aegis TaxID=1735272 RepID=UPI001B88D1A5|nr:proline-rich extensin-like protein EPR1 [Gigantopelta aegis]
MTLVYGDPVKKPPRKRRRRKTDAPGMDRGGAKPAAQLPAAALYDEHPRHRSTPAKLEDPAQPEPTVEPPGEDLNQAVMESPPQTPLNSASGTPVMPPPPRKSAAVESQARSVAVAKRKAIASPGDQPVKPGPPTQPPKTCC